MALALSQPPETHPARLGQAAKDPAILQAVQEELGNCLGGVITQRLQKCEDELTEQKALVAKLMEQLAAQQAEKDDPPDLREVREAVAKQEKQLTKQKQMIRDMSDGLMGRMRRVYNGEEVDWDQENAEMDATVKGSVDSGYSKKSRKSWNGMHSNLGDGSERGSKHEKHNQKDLSTMQLEDRAATGTDDLTVDRWGFRQSCWDAAAFIGDTDLLLPLEALAVTFLVILNIGVQLCFTTIVMMSLVHSTVGQETQDDYHLWRTNTGHTMQFMDKNTMESLASRVCRGDGSLYLSDTQTTHVSDIDRYLYDNAPFNGPMMAMMAIYVWILTVSKEFHVLKDMATALLRLPGEETVVIKEKDRLVFQDIRFRRTAVILFLAGWRALIAAGILVAGVWFLAVTIQISELLLNAIALEFILNVDELLYQAMAPMKTRRFLLLLKPLPLKKHKAWKGLDLSMFVVALCTFGLSAVVFAVFLGPEMENMKATKGELCAGFLDFTYTPDKLGGMTWSRQKNDPQAATRLLLASDRYKVIRNVIEHGDSLADPRNNYTHAALVDPGGEKLNRLTVGHMVKSLLGPGITVENVAGWSVAQHVSKYNTMCSDVLSRSGKASFPDSMMDQAEASIADALAARSLPLLKAKCTTTFTGTVRFTTGPPPSAMVTDWAVKYTNLKAVRVRDGKWGKFVFYQSGLADGYVKMFLVHGGGDNLAIWLFDNRTWPIRQFQDETCLNPTTKVVEVNDQCILDNWDSATIIHGSSFKVEDVECQAAPTSDYSIGAHVEVRYLAPMSGSMPMSTTDAYMLTKGPQLIELCDTTKFVNGALHDNPASSAAVNCTVPLNAAECVNPPKVSFAACKKDMTCTCAMAVSAQNGMRGKVVSNQQGDRVVVELAEGNGTHKPGVFAFKPENLRILQAVDTWADFQELVDCKDLSAFCSDFEPPGVHVRFLCPEVCGCRDPNSTLALPWADMGCSDACPANPAFRNLLNVNCTENPQIHKTVHFQETVKNWRFAADSFGGSAAQTLNTLADMLLQYGCMMITLVLDEVGIDTCSLPDMRPLHFMCPVSCGCINSPNILCPSTCAALRGVEAEPEPKTGYCFSASGVTTLTAMGKLGMLGSPSAGDEVPPSTKSTLEGMNLWVTMRDLATEQC